MAVAIPLNRRHPMAARASVWVRVRLNPGDIPRLDQASLDGRVLLFAEALSALTASQRPYCGRAAAAAT